MKIFTKSVWQMTADGMHLVPQECESFEHEGPVSQCKGPKAPKTPDPNVVSDAQTRSNIATAAYQNALGHGNSTDQFGSNTYTTHVDPTTGATVYDSNYTLNPGQQQLFNERQQQQLALAQAQRQPMDTSGLPDQVSSIDTNGLPQLYGSDDLLGARQQIQDALYKRQASYLDPQYADRERELNTSLANKGIVEGSEAWKNAQDQFSRERTFDYDTARNSAITGGMNEMQGLSGIASGNRAQLYGERTNNANFQNSSRAQALQDLIARRNQPLSEFNSLWQPQGGGNGNGGQGGQSGQLSPTDVSGNIWNSYNGQLGSYNTRAAASAQQNSAYTQAAATLLMYGLGASDARVKSNVKRIGLLPQGVGLYEYEYDGDPLHERHRGVMAQEVEKNDPDAVITGDDGVKRVHYGRVMARALEDYVDAAA